MSEYILQPNQKQPPSPQDLLNDLSRKGWTVEMNLKGSPEAWEAIRFFRPGPPEEVECFLMHDPETSFFTVSLPDMPAHGAPELQFRVLESLIDRLDGKVIDSSTHRALTKAEWNDWASRYNPLPLRLFQGSPRDVFWRLFPPAVTVAGITCSIYGPVDKRLPALGLAFLALLATAGLFFHSARD
jgi:hypothetical protein